MTAPANRPQAVLDRLVELFPDFAPIWHDPENVYRHDDGSFTNCGVFSEFSDFFRDRYEQFLPEAIAALGVFISTCVASSDKDLANTAAVCFLENISGERFSRDFERQLSGGALEFYRDWNVSG